MGKLLRSLLIAPTFIAIVFSGLAFDYGGQRCADFLLCAILFNSAVFLLLTKPTHPSCVLWMALRQWFADS